MAIIGISGKIGSGKDTVGLIIQYLTSPNGFGGMDVEDFIRKYEGKSLDCDWEVRKFADKLKDIVCLLIGCTREELENREFKESDLGEEWWIFELDEPEGKIVPYLGEQSKWLRDIALPTKLTPRKLLQLLGTDCGRDIIHPQIWVNALFADYKPLPQSIPNFRQPDDIDDMPINLPNWLITDMRFPNELNSIKIKDGITIRVNRGDGNTGTHPSETSLDNAKFDYTIENQGSLLQLAEKVEAILIKESII